MERLGKGGKAMGCDGKGLKGGNVIGYDGKGDGKK